MIDEVDGPAQDDPIAKAKRLRAAGASIAQVRQYLTSKGYTVGDEPATVAPRFAEGHSRFTPAQLAGRADRAVATAEDEADVENTGVREAQLGGIAALGRAVPLVDDAQAGAMSLVSGTTPEAEQERLHAAEDVNPASPATALTGGVIAALATQRGLDAAGKSRVVQAVRNGWRAARGTAPTATAAEAASPLRTLADAPKRLIEPSATTIATEAPIQTVLQRAASTVAVPTVEATGGTMSKAAAKSALERLLGNSVAEGQAELQAAREAVPPTNWTLMQQIEDGLLRARGVARPSSIPRLRAIAEANP